MLNSLHQKPRPTVAALCFLGGLPQLDLADLHPGIELPVAGLAAGVLPTPGLLDHELRALGYGQNLGRHGSAFQDRLADLQLLVVPTGQDAIEDDLFASRQIAIVNVQLLSLGDLKLLSAVGNYCVHGSTLRVCLVKSQTNQFSRLYRSCSSGLVEWA